MRLMNTVIIKPGETNKKTANSKWMAVYFINEAVVIPVYITVE